VYVNLHVCELNVQVWREVRDQNAGQTSNIQIENKFFESVEEFKYLGSSIRHQNSIHGEIKSRLKS
jgi:hypothetical protein